MQRRAAAWPNALVTPNLTGGLQNTNEKIGEKALPSANSFKLTKSRLPQGTVGLLLLIGLKAFR